MRVTAKKLRSFCQWYSRSVVPTTRNAKKNLQGMTGTVRNLVYPALSRPAAFKHCTNPGSQQAEITFLELSMGPAASVRVPQKLLPGPNFGHSRAVGLIRPDLCISAEYPILEAFSPDGNGLSSRWYDQEHPFHRRRTSCCQACRQIQASEAWLCPEPGAPAHVSVGTVGPHAPSAPSEPDLYTNQLDWVD